MGQPHGLGESGQVGGVDSLGRQSASPLNERVVTLVVYIVGCAMA